MRCLKRPFNGSRRMRAPRMNNAYVSKKASITCKTRRDALLIEKGRRQIGARLRRRTRLAAAVVYCALAAGAVYPPARAQSLEYTIKAHMIEKIIRFVHWPRHALPLDSAQPFIISVYGSNPFGGALVSAYSQSEIKGHPVEIRFISRPDLIKGCHALFISKVSKTELTRILRTARELPVFTIADTQGFANAGVQCNFYTTSEHTIQFELNETALSAAGFSADFRLFQIARIIHPIEQKGKKPVLEGLRESKE